MTRAFLLSILLAFGNIVFAEDDSDDQTTVEYPSPDGRHAFRYTRGQEKRTVDLIEQKTGKVLRRVAECDEGRFSHGVLWAPGGKRFAMMVSTSRFSSKVEVYARDGDTFRAVVLPEIDEPKIPAKYDNEKRVWHISAIDFRSPVRWTKAGSLVVECETTTDGNGSYITAMRTVVFGFDRAGKAKILSNENKVTAHFE